MIRKFARIDAPVEVVREIFHDTHGWAGWMPGIKRLRVLVETDDSAVVEFVQEYMGRSFTQVLDCQFRGDRLKQTQTSGWFKRWEASWRFFKPPEQSGTTVSCELHVEIGLIGLITPRRLVQRAIDEIYNGIIRGARTRARAVVMQRKEPLQVAGETLLQVFETAGGLEIRIGDKKYRLEAVE
jgi:ribosome-associated toxin RatA of RatAB toxin-antitoxin module